MKRLIGLLLSAALLTGMLAGCAGTADSSSQESASQPGESAVSQWPRTITDAAGNEVVLKEKPERIAILHSTYLEYFFALDTPPVASTGSSTGNAMKAMEAWETMKPYVGTAEMIDLGSARDLNLEAILESNPDVIVTFKGHNGLDKIYAQLQQIAPVVLMDFSASWQEQTRACAQVVGKEQRAEEVIQQTEQVLAQAKEKLSKQTDQTVAIFRSQDKTFVSRATKEHYDTFGITQPEGYPEQFESMSLEAVAKMNPDIIIFQDYIETSQSFVKTQEASTVWQSLDAVKNGRVYYFDDSLNTFGPLATRLMAEKLVQVLEGQ